MPERTGRALLHWIDPPEVRPVFYSSSVTTPASVDAFVDLCQAARTKAVGPVVVPGGRVQPLPAQLANKEVEVRQTEQFRSAYEPFGATFASILISDLITPQWWVDLGYVEDLVASVPPAGDEEALFNYCFATGQLEPPMLLGINGAIVVSGRRALGAISPLRVQSANPQRVTFEFDALPRPNWLWMNVIQPTGRIIILNGVHHLLALVHAGRDRAYCLLGQNPVEQLFNYAQEPGIFRPQQLTASRPPLLRDYLDDNIADAVSLRAVDQFMRFGVKNPPEIGFVPQSEA